MTKRRRVVRRATTAPVPPHTGGPTVPSTYGLWQQAVGNADQWWTGLGSAPPAAQVQEVAQLPADAGPNASAFGYYGTGRIDVADAYLQHLSGLLRNPSLKVRRTALAQMWGLAAHERGHNIGYGHDRGGIMDPNLPGIPGQAYQWAAEMLPSKKVLRKKRGGK